ncbi:MAG: hypothetical protein A3E01_04585 [Gammaproteobacteria bacterium RIFCSPHIGHO2_12_FULL_63_22]|nr:MAG: hypothetical protein A3E01_04585 [Gammaproteobacteria bacterium RIFCSPHIGHO2_12_FULL_63_22]
MNPGQAFRFLIWAQSCRDKGRHLDAADVMVRWEVSRATAFRLLAHYFDAMGWQWPKPRDTQLRVPKGMGAGRDWREERACA